jgi:hypothetical protein
MTDFDAREALAAATDRHPPFRFTDLDGNDHEVPSPMLLTERHAEMLATGDLASVFREVAPEAWGAIEALPLAVGAQLARAWLALGGDLGKSLSPSSPTNGAEPPSPPTSPSEASTWPASTSA